MQEFSFQTFIPKAISFDRTFSCPVDACSLCLIDQTRTKEKVSGSREQTHNWIVLLFCLLTTQTSFYFLSPVKYFTNSFSKLPNAFTKLMILKAGSRFTKLSFIDLETKSHLWNSSWEWGSIHNFSLWVLNGVYLSNVSGKAECFENVLENGHFLIYFWFHKN